MPLACVDYTGFQFGPQSPAPIPWLPARLSGGGAPPTGHRCEERPPCLWEWRLGTDLDHVVNRAFGLWLLKVRIQRKMMNTLSTFRSSPSPNILGKKMQRKRNGNVPLEKLGMAGFGLSGGETENRAGSGFWRPGLGKA